MARIRLDLPEKFRFKTEMAVRITDLNYGNHMGNDALLSMIHEARYRFFRFLGFSESDIGGMRIVLSDAVIVYQAEAFYGDILEFHVTAGDPNRYGCDIFYSVIHREDKKAIAGAKTGIVFIDPATQKVTRMPEIFRTAFPENPIS